MQYLRKTRRKPPDQSCCCCCCRCKSSKQTMQPAKSSHHTTTQSFKRPPSPGHHLCLSLLAFLALSSLGVDFREQFGSTNADDRNSDNHGPQHRNNWSNFPSLLSGETTDRGDKIVAAPRPLWRLALGGVGAAETYILRDQHPRLISKQQQQNETNESPASHSRQKSPVSGSSHHKQQLQQQQQQKASKLQTVAKQVVGVNGLQVAPRRSSLATVQRQSTSQFTDASSAAEYPGGSGGLQISITPRNAQIRVPVGENTILKCLISSQVNKFTKKFDVHWSRYMYDESVYEQIESFAATSASADSQASDPASQQETSANLVLSGTQDQQQQQRLMEANPAEAGELWQPPFNRQQQLRDFQRRSRQETNRISDLLLEATLTISPVKPSDNATYYCTASDGQSSNYDEQQNNRARIDLVTLSKPVIRLERLQPARDSKSALVHWLILSHGNTPIKRTILMVRNESLYHQHHSSSGPFPMAAQQEALDATGSSSSSSVVVDSDNYQWQRIDIAGDGESATTFGDDYYSSSSSSGSGRQAMPEDSVVRADVDVTSLGGGSGSSGNDDYATQSTRYHQAVASADWRGRGRLDKRQRTFNLSSLLPGVTYNLRLAAINDMGQSNWTHLSATMPNEIPAQINEMFLLSRSNDSLAIGWKRPAYDSSKTIRYEMQLFDLNRTLTLDANTNTSALGQGGSGSGSSSTSRLPTNFMYIFVNLNPGTDYHFHVRACSRVGCSAFSSPKLLASTLDGEPEEPADVELNCQPDSASSTSSGNLSVSWLPPVNSHGQLTNYSVTLESQARYLNQSGEWQVDEWRATMETANNHTLSLDLANLLMPNTNYTVRVCANNRSKHCGRLSPVSSKTQCSTPPELPLQLPAGIRLLWSKPPPPAASSEPTNKPEGGGAESLLLDLPHLSRRNGTIDCVQIVLVRLPASYPNRTGDASNAGQLDQFLPKEPSDIRLMSYAELRRQQQLNSNETSDGGGSGGEPNDKQQQAPSKQVVVSSDNDRAFAYLAEEISTAGGAQASDKQQQQQQVAVPGDQVVVLGDGSSQSSCQRLLGSIMAEQKSFDGQLQPNTYYTGFIRLLMVRYTSERKAELVAKYSSYFEPVRTGVSVMEIPMPDADADQVSIQSTLSQDDVMSNPFSLQYYNRSVNFNEFASHLSASLRSNVARIYHSASGFVATNLRLESIGNYIMRSSPMMQLLQMGVIVLALSLFLLFVIYLILLPNSMRRKRKRKLKRQLQKHQEAANDNFMQLASSQQPEVAVETGPQHFPPPNDYQQPQISQTATTTTTTTQQQGQDGAFYSPQQVVGHLHHQQPMEYQKQELAHYNQQPQFQPQAVPVGYGTVTGQGPECPIHSSPMNQQQQHLDNSDNQQSLSRRPSVHVCQPTYVSQQQQPGYGTLGHQAHHHHHHHHHSSQQQQQQVVGQSYVTQEMLMRQQQDQYERNCRTMSRARLQSNGLSSSSQDHYAYDAQMAGSQTASRNLTLSHHNSVLALAKKINKSIPLSLFGSVLECRLRNNWLREEYEQLPRQLMVAGSASESRHLLPLKPQLIVSRNDTVSALISGNDLFDASLIRGFLPAAAAAYSASGGDQVAGAEKRIICAKSPLDADSVWDFWRLVYEQEVSTMVMLTQTEDQQTGDVKCAQYWPTCDNEETTILSPCNEYVQKSDILPAKFKIRQETLGEGEGSEDEFRVRRLTLMVMATRPGENEQNEERRASATGEPAELGDDTAAAKTDPAKEGTTTAAEGEEEDEEGLVIVERSILHLQYVYWNTSSLANQMRLIKFIEMANERHLRTSQQQQQQESPSSLNLAPATMLVHCSNGLGRSGLFTAMSFIIDELSFKLSQQQLYLQQQQSSDQKQLLQQQQQLPAPKLNIFQLVSRLRAQREMLLSPYRLYELLYQLTLKCIPAQDIYSHQRQHKHFHSHNHQPAMLEPSQPTVARVGAIN